MLSFLRWLLRLLYGFNAHNEGVLQTPGPVLLLPNHLSWWDWLLIGVCLEEDWRFVTSSTTAELSWVHKRIMANYRTFPVDMNSPFAVKHMAEYLKKGGRLVLFPEGRISTTGTLMKLFDGTGFLVAKTHANVITAFLRGAERLPFSRNPGRKQWFPRISVHFSNVHQTPDLAGASMSAARVEVTDWLRDRMVRQQFETEMEFGHDTVPKAIQEAARRLSGKVVLEDVSLQQVSYRRLFTGAQLLAAEWRRRLSGGPRNVGVLLPNVNGLPVTILSLWGAGKTPAILNYTTGPTILMACARLAGLKQVITSRAFLSRAKMDVSAVEAAGIELVYLEDVRSQISAVTKLNALVRNCISPTIQTDETSPSDTAIVLFTSGSEGDPKAVELTHRNLLANIRQMLSVIDLMETDRFFNALPLFHSFGLTVGLLLPLMRGVFVLLYVSPLHYKVVPSAFYNLNCTVLFGTNTFLNGYARKAHPYDFRTLRYLFAGAEKLQDATAQAWMQRFGVRILEGYGATECGPGISVNVPMRMQSGTAGQFLPGIDYKLEPVEGVDGESGHVGRLLVRGPNVMRGYLNVEANAKFLALGGWYDTGDIVRVRPGGYVQILGRLKRFAKVSGEMVSLTAVEEALANAFPQYGLKFTVAVVAKVDESKGERLIAVTNEPKLSLEEIREAIRARGLNNLAMPRELKYLHELPQLGTGKVNHRELEKLV
jgi:acyl-[acyl-carrier-protein]-phospholipid O-acyltransferase/long-chain-fatty-acid--[acyl-carrier-protein] ligase